MALIASEPYFHLSFRPNLKLVSSVREFTVAFYQRVLADPDLSSRIALATHELLENAVSYAVDDETTVRVEIEGDQLVIKTWNRSSYESAATVRALIDEINEFADPDQFYLHLMTKTAHKPEGSGLGLARIRAEAEMQLSYEIERDRVCIRATTPVYGRIAA